MNRRTLLRTTTALTSSLLLPDWAAAEAQPLRADPPDRIPQRGEAWNESVVFPDEATMRPVRRLTSARTFNQKPTYHLNAGFARDNAHTVFATYRDGDNASALVRADVRTGDLKVLDHTEPGAVGRFDGNRTAMLQNTDFALALVGTELRLYDVFTGEKRLLVPESSAQLSSPIGSCDGKYVFFTRNDRPFNVQKDTHLDPYQMTGVSFVRVNVKSGQTEVIYRDDACRSAHIIPHPTNPDLLLIDRDWPPGFSYIKRGDANADKTRVWVLNLKTKALTEIRPRDRCRFAWHANWNYRGDRIYYHGPSHEPTPLEKNPDWKSPYPTAKPAQHYIGVADLSGKVLWEGLYPSLTYGHTSSHATDNCIIVDNLLTQGYLVGIRWREDGALPSYELLGKHNSDYRSGQQVTHAHCQMSTDGKWLLYNAFINGRADVYALAMS